MTKACEIILLHRLTIFLRFLTDSVRGPRPKKGRALADGINLLGVEEDGFLVIPYMIDGPSFSGLSWQFQKIRNDIADMEKDLGCIKFKYLPQSSSSSYDQETFSLNM